MKAENIQKLRNGETLLKYCDLLIDDNKCYYQFQLNRKEKKVCWLLYRSYNRQDWVCLNAYLSLHDVRDIIDKFLTNKQLTA